ncbi:MAG: DUF3791 domain-containing protein [Chitinispirillales bacterium]|jgi:hypothetical protein|nr:DUF3791 domain-containing protein [Chitinispirillales bacterium]
MSEENIFLVFVVEYYRNKKNISGKETIALFDKYDIWNLAKRSYFIWHIESPENFVREIDNCVSARKP